MADIVNIEVDQGTTKGVEFDWINESTGLPIDLTGYTAKMQVRQDIYDPDVLLEFSTANGRITLDTEGRIVILIIPTDTTVFGSTDWTEAIYDLLLTNTMDSSVSMVAKGKFIILPAVTSS